MSLWRSPPPNKALEPIAVPPGELRAGADGQRLNARSLGDKPAWMKFRQLSDSPWKF